MPFLFNKKLTDEIQFMVWKLSEPLAYFLENMELTVEDFEIIDLISNDFKKREYLAGKNAIVEMSKLLNVPFEGFEKDEHGKPFLVNSEYEISLTHTLDYVGVVFSSKGSVGIDIEKPRPQIMKVLKRLFSERELETVGEDLDLATIYWSAKEALYKLYGKRKVDFKENLFLKKKGDSISGKIKMLHHQAEHQVFYEKLEEYFLVIAY